MTGWQIQKIFAAIIAGGSLRTALDKNRSNGRILPLSSVTVPLIFTARAPWKRRERNIIEIIVLIGRIDKEWMML